jgi:REP element-mobilizing transposase RayT
MRKLQVSYSMYFNKEYGDSIKQGLKSPVFEGRFKAKEVVDEAYLSQLVTYVEHNAVKHEIVERIEDWPYTSYEKRNDTEKETDFFSDFD